MSRRPTLRDVAEAAGVSMMTVSNVINGRAGTMAEQTRLRVEREIRQLEYRPQTHARGLRLAEHRSIGMIVVDTAPNYLADPFTTQLVAGLSNRANAQGYAILLQGIHPSLIETSPMVRDVRTDGLCAILSGPSPVRDRTIELLSELHQPIVLFQEAPRGAFEDICVLRQDDFAGGRMLGEEVLRLGARNLLLLLPLLFWPAIRERARGVRAAVRDAGPGVRLRILRLEEGAVADGRAAMAHEFAERGVPDALLAGNDQMALGAIKLLRGMDLVVPRDVMVTGFNGFDFWNFADPTLTTIRSDAYGLGVRGGDELVARLQTGAFADPQIVLPVRFQPGASTGMG